jgi:hypothetical protein
LVQSFQLVPAIVALFFAGVLYRSEQAQRMSGIVGAAPVPPTLLLLAKFLALALLLLVLALVTAATVAVLQLAAGRAPDIGMLTTAYVLPKTYDWLLFGILALFLQAVAPNKLAGWGLLVLYMIGGLALDQAGFTDPLYRYAAYPGAPLPPGLSGAEDTAFYRLMWGGAALLMLSAALLLSGRGFRLRNSGRTARRRLEAAQLLVDAAEVLLHLVDLARDILGVVPDRGDGARHRIGRQRGLVDRGR